MFSAPRVQSPVTALGSACFNDARGVPTNRRFALVAVASRSIVDLLERELRDWLAPRPLSTGFGQLHSGADRCDVRVTFRFEANDGERRALADLVQHLCVIKGVRYLRLDAR